MNTYLRGIRIWCAFLLGGVLVGASVYSTLFAHVQYANVKRALDTEKISFSPEKGFMRYGIVVATDQAHQTITISSSDKFYNSQKRFTVKYPIKPGAPITRQTLISDGAVYTALSESQQISFSDIRVGEHIAIYTPMNADGSLTATSVTVGDSL